ncbi:MAG: putative mobilization relaxase component [Frankiales bacterium]|nr:putative mobilization relaxase component [Frankiales bacterium]
MIGRVYRGGQVGGLLRYLYGPGRHNEHENPHLVAAWDLTSPTELATLEPRVLAGEGARAVRDFAPMIGSLELATAFRPLTDKAAAKVVWHCPLRTAPGDRRLSDEEWSEIARDVMHRTGIAERGDDGGCRWIAVKHDEVSVHLVAVLARQDGAAVRIGNDYRRVREACRAAEKSLGLVGTAPADRTAATHASRPEVEKARRTRGPDATPDRVWLRERVQIAALQALDAPDFLARLTAAGALVRERRDPDGELTGYAVARAGPAGTSGEAAVFYGGGKLAPDLTLPKLLARWHQQADVDLVPAARRGRALPTPVERAAAVVKEAASGVRAAVSSGNEVALAEAGALAQATAQVLAAAAQAVDGDRDGGLGRAARRYDRASREPSGRPLPVTPHSRALQDVGLALLKGGRISGSAVPVLLAQVLLLVDAVRQLRQAQGRVAQAQAAQQAGVELRAAVVRLQRDAAARAVAQGQGARSAVTGLRPQGLPTRGARRQ